MNEVLNRRKRSEQSNIKTASTFVLFVSFCEKQGTTESTESTESPARPAAATQKGTGENRENGVNIVFLHPGLQTVQTIAGYANFDYSERECSVLEWSSPGRGDSA